MKYSPLYSLWKHVAGRRRKQLGLLLVLMLFASIAEVVSIGAVLPFLGVLTDPVYVFNHELARSFVQFFEIASPEQLLLPLTLVFVLAAIISGVIRLFMLWAQTRLGYAIGADMSYEIYRRTLYQPYSVHISRNSSEIISGISNKTNLVAHQVILPVLIIVSSAVILLIVLIAMIAVEPIAALTIFLGFGLIYGLIVVASRKRLLRNGECISEKSDRVVKALQEGLGGIRDVLIDGSQATYCAIFRAADKPLRRAQADNLVIGGSPRYGVEALGVVLIAMLAYNLTTSTEEGVGAIPVLGALALAAQRMLPVLQQAYWGWSSIRGAQSLLVDILELLQQVVPSHISMPPSTAISYKSSITLRNIDFSYVTDAPLVLDGVNLEIHRGERIGIIGKTGSGKSTLLDILMGLLEPTEGELMIDGEVINGDNYRNWQMRIAHVPQVIFLSDSTVAENIAFGVPREQIDYERVRKSAKEAQIADVIDAMDKQYNTFVGERGVRLSGGQRQRIGIARALYKNADVIVLDEATSALDNNTEYAVIDAIENISDKVTVIVVAHRLTTLRGCDYVVELDGGKIKGYGSYEEIVGEILDS